MATSNGDHPEVGHRGAHVAPCGDSPPGATIASPQGARTPRGACKATGGLLKPDDFTALRAIIRKGVEDAAESGWGLAGAWLGGDLPYDPDDPAIRGIIADVGTRVKGIADETIRRVQGYVERAAAEGMSPQKLAGLIEKDESGAFGRARALVIARTETGNAYNLSSMAGYRASGRVSRVQIYDGEECTCPEGHGDEPFADGMVVDLDEAEKHPLAHPNCVRGWAPLVGEEAP
jgi:hypothetical protein